MQRFPPAEFSLVEYVQDVARDDRLVSLKQLGHLAKRQPRGLAIEANLDARSTVLPLVQEEFSLATWRQVSHSAFCSRYLRRLRSRAHGTACQPGNRGASRSPRSLQPRAEHQ